MTIKSKAIVVGSTCYEVKSDGSVWSRRSGKFLKGYIDKDGYRCVALGGGNAVKVHTLVLTCFVRPKKSGEQARHLDGNPSNNNLKNLRWGTGKQNWSDRKKHKRISSGRLKLTPRQVNHIVNAKKYPGYLSALAKKHNISFARIQQLRNGARIQSHANR